MCSLKENYMILDQAMHIPLTFPQILGFQQILGSLQRSEITVRPQDHLPFIFSTAVFLHDTFPFLHVIISPSFSLFLHSFSLSLLTIAFSLFDHLMFKRGANLFLKV